jgi:hypothetical protein
LTLPFQVASSTTGSLLVLPEESGTEVEPLEGFVETEVPPLFEVVAEVLLPAESDFPEEPLPAGLDEAVAPQPLNSKPKNAVERTNIPFFIRKPPGRLAQ